MGTTHLKTDLRQELHLAPQLLQFLQLLQMNSLELEEHLSRILEENPVLEREESHVLSKDFEELRQKVSWMDGEISSGAAQSWEGMAEAGRRAEETESLTAFLRDQLDRKNLPKDLLALSKYLVELLDEDGFLAEEDLEGLRNLKIPEELLQRALDTVQALDPAGVGARSLSECLLLQLNRKEEAPLAREIVIRFLPDLAQKRYGAIARALGVTPEEIQQAEVLIGELEPYPGRAFQTEDTTVYIRPDVFVAEVDGEWRVLLNEAYLPRVYLNQYYTKILQESDEKETKEYLREKLRQAKWLIHGLSRRAETLQQCAETIFEVQKAFFMGITSELTPLCLAEIAAKLEVHPSTISRMVRGKYLQCSLGTYPLKYFLSRPAGDGISRQAIKQKILGMIAGEDPKKPLSDQRLCERLEEEGVHISRRAVAKYRTELGIMSSAVRKVRK